MKNITEIVSKGFTRRNIALIGALLGVVAIFLVINFSDTLSEWVGLGEPSAIELFVPEAGAAVYLDDRQIQVTGEADNTVDIRDIDSGEHSLIVAKEGYWPWSKELDLESGRTFQARAFLVPTVPDVTEILPGSAEYSLADLGLRSAKLPDEDSKRLHKDGKVAIWIDNNDIRAEWMPEDEERESYFCKGTFCNDRRRVLNSSAEIKSLDFFGDREDVLMFATGDRVYAIEIDQNGTQNLQPVYEGSDLSFIKASNQFIYVRDNGKIFRVMI